MLFNSIEFAIFLPTIFILYWFVFDKNLRIQNLLLLFASYVFYACWDWHFLFLLIFSTLLDYFTGLKMSEAKNQNIKNFWFWLSISINLGFLGVFKYYNFFISSFAEAISHIGLHVNVWTLNIILPVGISFYTFHGLSYVIDIYKGRIEAERNFIDYSVFVSFFPLLVAGPIERATHLLPQIQQKRAFNYAKASDGLRQIVWGLFKKVVIADNCALYVNMIFDNYENLSGIELLLGAIYFAFQIYGDFSGYSDIALGTAKLFGIDLLKNFAYPYFSRDVAEFWRRWHISLTTWFRDYVYIPLGGSRGSTSMKIRNTMIIFLISGFWHGAKWNFVLWGLIHALFFIPLLITRRNKVHIDTVAKNKLLPSFTELLQMTGTFFLITFAWVFFRADSLIDAFMYLNHMFSKDLFSIPHYVRYLPLIFLLIIPEWLQRDKQHVLDIDNLPTGPRWAIYVMVTWLTTVLGNYNIKEFIYFQF